MKSHPILFNGDMVRAILNGRKLQTRRPIKGQPFWADHEIAFSVKSVVFEPEHGTWLFSSHPQWVDSLPWTASHRVKCPYGVPGDELWVRETWAHYQTVGTGRRYNEVSDGTAGHRADGHDTIEDFRRYIQSVVNCEADEVIINGNRWRPSIHMPRWASRLTLKVTDVRIQRLMDASEEDTIAEGFTNSAGYQSAMMKAYGAGITYVNPWVWAITFEVRQ